MASLETILADLGPVVQGNNILLFIILIALFVVGYKVLQTVIRLGLVAILSGVFLVVLDMVGIGPAVTVQRFILFMVLGTALFIFYSTIATAFTVFDWLYAAVKRLVKWAFKTGRKKPHKKSRLKKLGKKVKDVKDAHGKSNNGSSSSGSKEKEIVLGELDDE